MKALIIFLLLAGAASAQKFIHNPDCGEKQIGVIYPDGKKGCMSYGRAQTEGVTDNCKELLVFRGWQAYNDCRYVALEKRLKALEDEPIMVYDASNARVIKRKDALKMYK